MTPAGTVTEYDLGVGHVVTGMAAGPDGRVWFGQNRGGGWGPGIGAITTDARPDGEYTPVEAVAEETVAGIRDGRFWILPASDRTDATIRARAESMLHRSTPTYLEDLR